MASMTGTVGRLDLAEAEHAVASGAAYIDLRPVSAYLDVHIPGSISLQYEFGPGMQQRARDCIPLDVPLVLLDHGEQDMPAVAGALRGKGFAVLGTLEDGVGRWAAEHEALASTTIYPASGKPPGTLLSVGDPGSLRLDDALFIPVGGLWGRADEVPGDQVTIIAGRGVRAALAVGMLERAGRSDLGFWKPKVPTRP